MLRYHFYVLRLFDDEAGVEHLCCRYSLQYIWTLLCSRLLWLYREVIMSKYYKTVRIYIVDLAVVRHSFLFCKWLVSGLNWERTLVYVHTLFSRSLVVLKTVHKEGLWYVLSTNQIPTWPVEIDYTEILKYIGHIWSYIVAHAQKCVRPYSSIHNTLALKWSIFDLLWLGFHTTNRFSNDSMQSIFKFPKCFLRNDCLTVLIAVFIHILSCKKLCTGITYMWFNTTPTGENGLWG